MGKKINIHLLLMVPVVAVLATGTVLEKFNGHDWTAAHIYGAWWFYLLLSLVGLYDVWTIVKERMWKQFYKFLLYVSVLFVLLGGLLTATTGIVGSVKLQPGVPTNVYATDDGRSVELPFAITLDRFEVVPYPGTKSPMDFVSHITVEDEKVDISMNNIYKRGGYRFYQEDYDDEGNSVLSVAYDPWGIMVTYMGYLLMAVGVVLLFVSRGSRFRRLAKGVSVAALLLIAGVNQSLAAPNTLPKATADKMGQMYVLYKGRVCPLQTLAKDFTTKLCGSARYEGLTPEQVLSGWLFYFNEWVDEPMIKVKGDDVHQLLGTDERKVSYGTFLAHQDAFSSSMGMGGPSGMPMGGMQKSKTMRAASEKFNLVQMLVGGKFVKMFPVVDSTGSVSWYGQNDDLPLYTPDDEYIFIRKQLSYCQELVVKGDYAALEKVFEKTAEYQRNNASDILPTKAQFKAERLYNHLTTGKWLAMMTITLGLVLFALAIFRTSNHKKGIDWMPLAIVLCITVFLLLIFTLRWIAGNHIPMAGGFDSMNLMAIVAGVIAVVASRRYLMAPSIGLLAMGFCLLVAMMSGSNPPVTHLMPVLSSPLLTLHVTVIMMSYALFFFIMLNGVAALFARSRTAEMKRVSLLMLYPAVTLLALGIVIGALWANISWGRYWAWDPKEVWALITLMLYIYPLLHLADDSRPAKFHIYCVLAFLGVVITYFGVNFILGGIHAYN